VHALASHSGDKLAALVWHYHADDVPGDEAEIELTVTGLPQPSGQAMLEHFRIDDDHSNAYTVWLRMGSPQQPTAEQYARLQQAGQLARLHEPRATTIDNGQATLRFRLPRQGVSLLLLDLSESQR
jgi:xylan 1,4-beta-xylosidase